MPESSWYDSDSASLNRLVNTGNSFEGTTLPPRPSGGKRVPLVSNFRILSQQTVAGGAVITLGWIQDELTENDYLEIFVFGNLGGSLNTLTNPRDTYRNVVNSSPILQGLKASESPFTFFVPVQCKTNVTIYLSTRHSSGMLSDYDFINSVSTVIDPGTSIIDYQATGAEVPMDNASDVTICSSIIPPDTLGQGKGLQINCNLLKSTGGSNFVIYKLKINSATYLTFTETSSAGDKLFEILLMNDPLKVNSQLVINSQPVFFGTYNNYASATIDTTSPMTITLTGNGQTSEKLTPIFWLIRKI